MAATRGRHDPRRARRAQPAPRGGLAFRAGQRRDRLGHHRHPARLSRPGRGAGRARPAGGLAERAGRRASARGWTCLPAPPSAAAGSLFQQGQAQAAVEALQELVARLESNGLEDEGMSSLPARREFWRFGPDARRAPAARAWPCTSLRKRSAPSRGWKARWPGQPGRRPGRPGQCLRASWAGMPRPSPRPSAGWRSTASWPGAKSRPFSPDCPDPGRAAALRRGRPSATAKRSPGRAAGDLVLQGGILQLQGSLRNNWNTMTRPPPSTSQALERFQTAGDPGSEMRPPTTCSAPPKCTRPVRRGRSLVPARPRTGPGLRRPRSGRQ